MSLREVAERMGLSFARIKQIETKALFKIRKRFPDSGIL
jgi:DNA-directed RNA polymerase sigma subunit (sigma70/sigma32)